MPKLWLELMIDAPGFNFKALRQNVYTAEHSNSAQLKPKSKLELKMKLNFHDATLKYLCEKFCVMPRTSGSSI